MVHIFDCNIIMVFFFLSVPLLARLGVGKRKHRTSQKEEEEMERERERKSLENLLLLNFLCSKLGWPMREDEQ